MNDIKGKVLRTFYSIGCDVNIICIILIRASIPPLSCPQCLLGARLLCPLIGIERSCVYGVLKKYIFFLLNSSNAAIEHAF